MFVVLLCFAFFFCFALFVLLVVVVGRLVFVGCGCVFQRLFEVFEICFSPYFVVSGLKGFNSSSLFGGFYIFPDASVLELNLLGIVGHLAFRLSELLFLQASSGFGKGLEPEKRPNSRGGLCFYITQHLTTRIVSHS